MKNSKKIIYIIFSLAIIFLIVQSFSNKTNIFWNKLFADINNSSMGYTCDRYAGLCYIDSYTSEYSSENDCLKECPSLRFKWYCNTTLAQCTRDFRGTYNNLETCWKNCYDKVSYHCDIATGLCLSNPTNNILTNLNNLTLEECTQNCRPATVSYIFDKTNQKCQWAYYQTAPTTAVSWNQCPNANITKVKYTKKVLTGSLSGGLNMNSSDITNLLGFNPFDLGNTIVTENTSYKNEPQVCVPSPTGVFENYSDCFNTLHNGFDSFKNYSGYTCNYQKGECVLTRTNAEFQATTLEDALKNCSNNCNPELDEIIKKDFDSRNSQSSTIIQNPKEHACFNHLYSKQDSCYSNGNCTIQNNICANNHASDPSTGWIDESACKNNGWYWLGSYKYELYKQLCICQSGKCVATEPNINVYCGDNVCNEWEKYKYIHGNGSISTIVSRYYCASDCY